MIKLEQVHQVRKDSFVQNLATELINDASKTFEELDLLLVFIVRNLLQILHSQNDWVVDPLA